MSEDQLNEYLDMDLLNNNNNNTSENISLNESNVKNDDYLFDNFMDDEAEKLNNTVVYSSDIDEDPYINDALYDIMYA